MDDQSSLVTIERPLCLRIAQDSALPECSDHWDLPESYEHWDLPEVYMPVVINNQQAIVRYKPRTPAPPDEKSITRQRPWWRQHWAWLLLLAVILLGGAAGGSLAGVLLSKRAQEGIDRAEPGASTVSVTINGGSTRAIIAHGPAQPSGTNPDSGFQHTEGTDGIPATGTATRNTDTNQGPTWSQSQVQSTTAKGSEPTNSGKDNTGAATTGTITTGPPPIDTQGTIHLQTTNPAAETKPHPTPKPTSQRAPQPSPLIGQPSKPTRPIHIGRAAPGGNLDKFLEVALFLGEPCKYTVIGKKGDWVCDRPFHMDDEVYQWKGCGGDTYLLWGKKQQMFGRCFFNATSWETCGDYQVTGAWLCSPE
ncbi:hypothetical protein B0T21DRAFT_124116 [Apiosordaria backusii]|uniref:Uncharacterized protein n=1 Tax=Apiosordaria backusii TaxID=314023 RepID=A0AA40K143_9PEZI|nr:hypothetical protein B0T21DRAFT_124116 [Apiosordaria backusii]